jgi:cell division protein FtsQ
VDEFDEDGEFAGRVRRPGVRLRFDGGLLPRTLWGRIAAGCGLVLLAGATVGGLLAARSFLLKDEHFVLQSASAVQIAGNSNLTRAQLLSVFGGDVERNIFTIPMAERRAELESLPWVAHATVMRLLPNRVRVAIVERTPVAFVRQGNEIGLVDANGVLLDIPEASDEGQTKYSFPVLTGISARDPLSTRAARMKIYTGFLEALDASGEKVSAKLSEVDVSNPEDVKAIVSSGGAGADILVHFGEEKFLERYHQYQQHLVEWRAQYPKLASVDMRYERQVVLEMQAGSAVPNAPASAAVDSAAAGSAPAVVKAKTVAEKPVAKVAKVAAPVKAKPPSSVVASVKTSAGVVGTPGKAVVTPPVATGAKPVAAASVAGAVSPAPVHHLTTAFSVPSALPVKPAAKTSVAAAPATHRTQQGAPQ